MSIDKNRHKLNAAALLIKEERNFMLKNIVAATIAISTAAAPVAVAADDNPTVYIAGDSTACVYGEDENYALPRGGWGMYLGEFLNGAEVVDLAKSGRSSKSFTVEDEYKEIFDNIEEGDYLLIQFGHNDAKNSSQEDIENRYTDPTGDKDTEGSFKHSLYTNYIIPAQEKGATPILLTPVSRNKFDEKGKVTDSHGLYDDAIRELAGELDMPYVDMTDATADLYNEIGPLKAKDFHAIFKDTSKGEDGFDNTHFNRAGARLMAALTALRLQAVCSNTIGAYVNNEAVNALTEMTVTRGDYTAEVVRLFGIEAEGSDCFGDVAADDENYGAIVTAKAAGIVAGNEKGKFMPHEPVTTEDMAVIMYRALRYVGALNENGDTSPLSVYSNSDYISEYAREAVAQLTDKGILDAELASSEDKLQPKASANSDSVMDIIARSFEAYTSALELTSGGDMSLDELEKVE